MADFGRGIKAGVAAGIVYLTISVIFAAIVPPFPYLRDFLFAAGLEIWLRPFHPSFFLQTWILPRIVGGVVFGVVYAALYDFLPGNTAVKKGVVLSSFLWILGAVVLIYRTPGWPEGWVRTSGMAGVTVCLSSVGPTLVSIVSALVFGALAGAIWNRLREKKVAEARTGSAALLAGAIVGVLTWARLSVAFVGGVVIRGAPLMDPGPFRWSAMLFYASVVFLGLPGWILTLVAWRKTRRGQSGFGLGVIGGVMMALTGHLLLPGVLAIIGTVLSRRDSNGAASTAEIEQ